MTVTENPQVGAQNPITVRYAGGTYQAASVGDGAAFELFATDPGPGWLPNPGPGTDAPYRRFVPATDIELLTGGVAACPDDPLWAPVNRTMSWETLHQLSQRPLAGDVILRVRRTATVRGGTRMVKVLSRTGLAEQLGGELPNGFCFRESDLAHLRTPADLAFAGTHDLTADAAYLLRWRAVDPMDYEIPAGEPFQGLTDMPTHARTGPPVIGTGFAPASKHLIPEFVTAEMADLPLPAGAALVAYTADGTEVPLFSYLSEQRTWVRMCGPRWRHLLSAAGITDQEYFPVPAAPTMHVGVHRGEVYEAVADPPHEYRIASKSRAGRWPVDRLARRTSHATWRGVKTTVVREDREWLRLRLRRPDAEQVAAIGAHCVDRGRYELWVPADSITDRHEVDAVYPDLTPQPLKAA